MIKSKQILLLTLVLIFSEISYSQSTINVSSHSATINGVIHDYSIGEMTIISTEINTNLIVTQGVLQPSSSNEKNVNDEINSTLIDFAKVYPNPVKNILFVDLLDVENANLQLYDALGKLVFETKNTNSKTSIDLSSYAAGNYYLVVVNMVKQTQKMSFKIQKVK